MNAVLRQAVRTDVPAIMRVRYAVKENRLVSRKIPDEEVVHAIEVLGRGWIIEDHGEVVAFAIGNSIDGNIWALFVDPAHEGRGYGRMLHDVMLEWLWSRGLTRLWLSTDPQTRARRFYERAGWREVGPLASGEVLLEMQARASEVKMKVDGSCHCGNIEFDAEVDADTVVVCHCTDCQTLTGSAFRVIVPAKTESVRMRGGPPRIYIKLAESGAKRVQAFCPVCGTPLYSSAEVNPTHLFIRLGAIRQRDSLRPTAQVWCRSAVKWLDDLDSVPGSPEQQALTAPVR